MKFQKSTTTKQAIHKRSKSKLHYFFRPRNISHLSVHGSKLEKQQEELELFRIYSLIVIKNKYNVIFIEEF